MNVRTHILLHEKYHELLENPVRTLLKKNENPCENFEDTYEKLNEKPCEKPNKLHV